MEAFFQPFAQFLLSLLPPEVRETRFETKEKKMDFSRFKARYERAFGGNGLSAELCWYVIKTFIKGYDENVYMTLAGYREVPRKERTVSPKTFEEVYDTAWRWYLNLMQKGFWDDQDLVRDVLQLEHVPPEFVVIFCDEAQDLTRLELQLLMSISAFHAYDLGLRPIRSLPYAFAGDPYQTLNPMGFQWSIVQSTFFQEVLLGLDPHGRLRLRMNPQSLNNNYRSSPGIVRASNLILLWRHVLFNHTDLSPQVSWRSEDGREPLKFIIGQNISQQHLKDWLRDTIIIVPCEEGQESAFIQKDDVLSELFRGVPLQEPPKNVLSAAAAKGLEFKRVVVYKFGEKCDVSIWQHPTYGEDGPIEEEYFFNKLYVAVSRATHHLYIIDTAMGDQRLWEHAEKVRLGAVIERSLDPQAWESNVQDFRTGASEDARGIREEDPLNNADQLKARGLGSRDIGLLRRAKQFYAGLGLMNDSQRCEAAALRIEGQYSQASNILDRIGDSITAGECLWEGSLWKDLVGWSKKHPELLEDYVTVARFRVSRSDDSQGVLNFCEFLRTRSRGTHSVDLLSTQWKSSVIELMRRVALLEEDSLSADGWLEVANALIELETEGFYKAASAIALCFYRASAYQRAVDAWERIKDTERREYFFAKSYTNTGRRLYWLERAEAYEEILEEWQRAGGLQLATGKRWTRVVESAIKKTDHYELFVDQFDQMESLDGVPPNWLSMIGLALERTERYWDASQVWIHNGNINQALICLKFVKIVNIGQLNILDELRDQLIRERKWNEALWLVNDLPALESMSRAERIRRRCDVLARFAHSEEAPHTLLPETHAKLRKAIRDLESRSVSAWHQWISVPDIGTALERLGESEDVVNWFKRHINSKDESIRSASRKRWIALKKQEAEVFNRMGRADMAQRVLQDIERKETVWQRPSNLSAVDFQQGDLRLADLPDGVKPAIDSDGFINLRLGEIEVKINCNEKKVSLTHSMNWKRVIVDFSNYTVSPEDGTEPTMILAGDSPFTATALNCAGKLVSNSDRQALELRIGAAHRPVVIEWTITS